MLNWLRSLFAKWILELRTQKKRDYNRVLPMGDYFIERAEKANYLKFGEGSTIYDSSYVFGDVKVGKNVWVGPFTILDGSGGLEIGDNCNVSAGVQIYSHDTVDRVIYQKEISKAKVKIGNNVYIGPNSIIAKGVVIGDNVIIGANSFVSKNISSNTKGWGTPFEAKGSSL